eukprot:scaffold25097_cov48-Phaeocystis_antarctica.AAC.3
MRRRTCEVFISGEKVTSCLYTSSSPTARSVKFVSTTLGLPRLPYPGRGGSGEVGRSHRPISERPMSAVEGGGACSGDVGRSHLPISASESCCAPCQLVPGRGSGSSLGTCGIICWPPCRGSQPPCPPPRCGLCGPPCPCHCCGPPAGCARP